MTALRMALLAAGTLAFASSASAQQVDPRRSLAARTSLVLVPRVNLEYDRAPSKGAVTFGGTAVWLPAMPAVAELSYQKTMSEAGATTVDIGGGWRLREALGNERVWIAVSSYRTDDSVFTTYAGAGTVARRFTMVRGGITSLRYASSLGPAPPGVTALYAGVSRNRLVNTGSSMTNLRVLQRTGVDLLVGSAPAGALSGSGVGFRVFMSRDVGGVLGWSAEIGSRPGFGGYGLATMDLYFMLTDVLR